MNLTDAERDLLVLLAQGETVKGAAARLGIHMMAAQRRLEQARRRTGSQATYQLMVAWALEKDGA